MIRSKCRLISTSVHREEREREKERMFNTTTFDFDLMAVTDLRRTYSAPFGAAVPCPFATGVDDETVCYTPNLDGHVVIVGPKGSGKTTAAQTLLCSALLNYFDVCVIDPVGGAADFMFLAPYAQAVSTNLEDAAATMKAINTEVGQRKDWIAEFGASSIDDDNLEDSPKNLIVFINEFDSLYAGEEVQQQPFRDPNLEAERQQQIRANAYRMIITEYASMITREARSAGVWLMLGEQGFAEESFADMSRVDGLETNVSRLCLGHTSKEYEIAPNGRGVWASLGNPVGEPVQVWYASESRYKRAQIGRAHV